MLSRGEEVEKMLEESKSVLVGENIEALGEISSSLRTTLSLKQGNINFSLLLEKSAVKRNQVAEKMLSKNSWKKNSFIAALMKVLHFIYLSIVLHFYYVV